MAKIQLGRGKAYRAHVLVDNADAEWLNQYSWFRQRGRRTHYAVRWTGARNLPMHREIMGLAAGDPREVDHINQNGLDNRRKNLRIVTKAEQRFNTSALTNKRSCPYRGVFKDKRRSQWYGQVSVAGTKHSTPPFATAREAHDALVELRARVVPSLSGAA